MTEAHKKRERRSRRTIKYAHGLDEETLLELTHQSNLALMRSFDRDLENISVQQRRSLKREGIITPTKTKKGYFRFEWTALGKELLKELEEDK